MSQSAHFTSRPLLVAFVRGDARIWRVSRTLRFYSAYLDRTIVVRDGFHTDFASVPKPFRGLTARDAATAEAAVVHDYLYSLQGKLAPGLTISRKDCDYVLWEAMIASGGVAKEWADVYWLAVRMGGRFAWGSDG